VALVWWCAAGALTVLSAALFKREIAILAAANPAGRLPWIGWPVNTPRSARALGCFAVLAEVFAVNCVLEAQGRHHLYDFLWVLPQGLVVAAAAAVSQARHNRRVGRAA